MVPFKLHHWLLEINNLCLPSDIASFMFLGICPTQPFPTVLTGGEPGPVQGLHSQNTLPKGNQRGRIPPLSLGEEFWRIHPEKKGNSSPVCFTTRMHSVHFCRINWAVCMPGVASVAILPRAALKRRWGILSRREGAAVVPGHQQIPRSFSIVLWKAVNMLLTCHYGKTVWQTLS